MAHYPEAMEERSPQRGQIIIYRDHPSTSSTEDNDVIDDTENFHQAKFHRTSPTRTTPNIVKPIRTKKTSCPDGYLITRREKSAKVRPRPKSLAFDQELIEGEIDEPWLIDHSSAADDIVSNVEAQEAETYHRIRKYRSVISLSSDNTSSVQQVSPQPRAMSKSVHQSPTKPNRTNPKMMDVSPQYFSSSQSKSKDQQVGASRVKQLLFRRMSRSQSTDDTKQESATKRSKSSSSTNPRSNMRFLKKKINDNEDDYLLQSPIHPDDGDNFDRSIDSNTIPSETNRPTLYSSAEESD